MASTLFPVKNSAHVMYVGLRSQADTKLLKSNPTIASGDFKISTDGGAFANLATLPTVTPASGTQVKISLSAGEMNGDRIAIACVDAAGAEWCDLFIELATAASGADAMATAAALTTAQTDLTTLTGRLTALRAGYLDNLSAGAVALQASITTLLANVAAAAADVWAYATRTLTQGAASVTAAVTGSSITVYRGTTWSIALTGLPVNTGFTAIMFTVKRDSEDTDAESIMHVRLNSPDVGSGLIYFEGIASPTAGQASITVNSSTAITITLAAATADDAPLGNFYYGVKYITASGVTQASAGGMFTVAADLPLAIT